jgi:hypothetical protein
MADSSGEWNSIRLLMTTPFGTNTSSQQMADDDDMGSVPSAILRPPPRRHRRPPLLDNVIVEMGEIGHDSASLTHHSPPRIAEDKL